LTRALFLVIAASLLVACEQDVVFNQDFSINILHPGPKWPKVKKLAPVELEVYKRFGKPDAFRVWWTPAGEIKTRTDLNDAFKKQKPKNLPPLSWIYLSTGKEVRFRITTYEGLPITDQVRLVLKYGDPEDVKDLGNGITQWMFFSAGKIFKMREGKIFEEKDFPAMGKYLKN
jgi:hypothetical protein